MHHGLEQKKKNTYLKKIITAVSFHHVLAPLFYRTEECLACFLETFSRSGELSNGNEFEREDGAVP
jgi:hypothetical protein